ncbi:3837_t:CDS:2 [Acaulospora colombiana]|uniref:3837_t:CDS:1 n=1 Tax=Acaulospora colombiana TaxID=27376 RepID=A0ACA9L2P1_9GLOM|nr:3837_t:CDS:2 [Acaulospora colombiana]
MTNALFDQDANNQRIMVISGMGGSGKTQLPDAFRFRHILFLDASSETSIRHSIGQRVRSLGHAYARKTAEEALQVLSEPDEEISTNWAIIFDNCDNLKIDISSFFPQCDHGFIIITTRNPQLGSLSPGAHVAVGVMSPEEGNLALLKSALGESRPTESEIGHALAIAKGLEYLPVALIQAGSFIKRQRCLHNYLDKLKRNRSNILQRKAMGQRDRHYHCVYDTLEVTYPELTRQCQMFLGLLSFVNYSGFSLTLVHRAARNGFRFEPADLLDRGAQFEEAIRTLHEILIPGAVWDEQFLDDLVEELEQYSLITRVDVYNQPTLRMHCLVNAWAYDRLSDRDRDKYRSAIVRLLISATSEDNQDMYEFLIPHLDEISSIWGSLHVNDRFGLVKVLFHARRIDDSVPLAENISQEVIERDGQRTFRTIPAFLLLSEIYWNNPEETLFRKAFPMDIETVNILSELVPEHHPLVLKTYAQLAKQFFLSGHHKEAEVAQREILGALENFTEVDVELSLQVMKDLAMTCANDQVQKYEEAMELSIMILKKRMEINGKDHWKTVVAGQELAAFYFMAFIRDVENFYKHGKLRNPETIKEAITLFEDIVQRKEVLRGPKHPDTLEVKLALGMAYARAGSVEATLLLKELIEIMTDLHGSKDPRVIGLKEHLWCALTQGQNPQDLLHIVVHKVGRIADGVEEGEDPLKDYMQAVRAELFKAKCNEAEVLQLSREILASKQEVLGPKHPETIEFSRGLTFLFSLLSRHEEAIGLWGGVVKNFGPNDPNREDAQAFLEVIEAIKDKDEEA